MTVFPVDFLPCHWHSAGAYQRNCHQSNPIQCTLCTSRTRVGAGRTRERAQFRRPNALRHDAPPAGGDRKLPNEGDEQGVALRIRERGYKERKREKNGFPSEMARLSCEEQDGFELNEMKQNRDTKYMQTKTGKQTQKEHHSQT